MTTGKMRIMCRLIFFTGIVSIFLAKSIENTVVIKLAVHSLLVLLFVFFTFVKNKKWYSFLLLIPVSFVDTNLIFHNNAPGLWIFIMVIIDMVFQILVIKKTEPQSEKDEQIRKKIIFHSISIDILILLGVLYLMLHSR